jgi:nucleoid-associated protein YgaU
LTGKGRSVDAVEKAILMAGNVKGVGRVVSSIEVVESGTAGGVIRRAEGEGIEYYTIKSGDTLSAIAKHFYGDASKYQRLFEANREVIQNPDKIFVGQVIRIPRT